VDGSCGFHRQKTKKDLLLDLDLGLGYVVRGGDNFMTHIGLDTRFRIFSFVVFLLALVFKSASFSSSSR